MRKDVDVKKHKPKEKIANASYINDFRKELCEWLDKNAPPLSELYQGSLALLYGKHRIPGWQNYVCQSVREIGNRLPDVFQGPEVKGTFEYKKHVSSIGQLWKDNGFSLDDNDPQSSGAEVVISRPLFNSIRTLLTEHEKVEDKISDKVKRLFSSQGGYNPSEDIPIANQWIEVTRWFVGQVHVNPLTKRVVDEKKLIEQFSLFENILGSIIRKFFHTLGDLDEILEQANN